MLLKFAAISAVAVFGMLVFSGQALAQSSNTLIAFTNQQRVAAGLTPLVKNDELMASAQSKAQDMLAHDYWAHFAPDKTSPWDFIRAAGYTYMHAGENLAKGFTDNQSVVTAWMQSSEHRKNILDPSFQDVGIAVVQGQLLGHKTTLVVAHYGKLKPMPIFKKLAPLAYQQESVRYVKRAPNFSWIIPLHWYRN